MNNQKRKSAPVPVSQRIRDSYNELTKSERQLAAVMLENYPVSGLGSITALAESSGVSSPTIARMAKKLGFEGFPDLQAALRKELDATLSNPIAKHDRWAKNAPNTHIINRFADSVTENLRRSLERIDLEEFTAVAKLLSRKKNACHIVGGRITRSLADYLFTHLQVIRDDLTLIASNANTWPHFVLGMKQGDVLIAFDIRRYEHNLLHLAKMATSKGVKLVLFTDQWGSPAAKYATYTFNSHIEAPSAWDSNLVIVFLIEALIAAIQSECWDETKDRMNLLEELFDQTGLFEK